MNWFPIKDFPGYQISEDKQRIRLVVHTEQTWLTKLEHKGIEKRSRKEYTTYTEMKVSVFGKRRHAWLWNQDAECSIQFWIDEDIQYDLSKPEPDKESTKDLP